MLAKRKTAIMREMEVSKQEADRVKRLRTSRKEEKNKQLVLPNQISIEYERQLRKLATKGGTNSFIFAFVILNHLNIS